MNEDVAVYTVRPGGTSLWIPSVMAMSLGIKWGDRLTSEQFGGEDIQSLVRNRIIAESTSPGGRPTRKAHSEI